MRHLPVLMYHAVSDLRGTRWEHLGVPPALFDEQLDAMRAAGHRLVGLSEALSEREADACAPVVALTFDDAYSDLYTEAAPILRRHAARATAYIPTAHVGGSAGWLLPDSTGMPPLLDWTDVRSLLSIGLELGSHSRTHAQLDVVPLPDLQEEVVGSRAELEDRVQTQVRSFCYPHGYHSALVRRVVESAGYHSACEVGRRLRPVEGRRYAISRLAVGPRHDPGRLVREVAGGGPVLEAAAKRVLTPAWRQVRRARRGRERR